MQPPQGMRAKGTVPGPHARTPASTARGWRTPTARPVGRQSGEGGRLTSDAPHNGGEPPSPTDDPQPRPRHSAPTGHAGRGDSAGTPHPHTRAHSTWMTDPDSPASGRAVGVGGAPGLKRHSQQWQATTPGDGPPPPPHTHTRAHSTWVADPNGPPSGRAVGGGGAPDLRRPSQRWKAPFPGTPFCHSHSEKRRRARAHTVGPTLHPDARNECTRDTRVAEPRLPAPEDGRLGEGQRLTPDAPHNSGGTSSRRRPPTTSAARSPHRACGPRGQFWTTTLTRPRPQHVGGEPKQPAEWAGSRGRGSA